MKTITLIAILRYLSYCPLIYASFHDNPPVGLPPASGTDAAKLQALYGTDFGFSGVSTFAHLPHVRCLTSPASEDGFDIAILGVPFDTAVSYRPGARFGPRAIRAASSRQTPFRSFNHRAGINPYTSWAKVLDCGDVPVSPFDNALAVYQMESAFVELLSRRSYSSSMSDGKNNDAMAQADRPKIVSLGGDHSLALPALRALNKVYGGPVAVLHFDAHLDTWNPKLYPSSWVDAGADTQADFNHGSMFWLASNEGLILNGSSVHAGLRTRLSGSGWDDYESDQRQGFLRIETDDIEELGIKGIVEMIIETIGTRTPVYLSVDIDVVDPGLAPGTGTPEPGGWTTRELIAILRGIEGLNLIGADVVEVSPAYDGNGEGTALAAAQVVFEIVTSMVKAQLKPDKNSIGPVPGRDRRVEDWIKSRAASGSVSGHPKVGDQINSIVHRGGNVVDQAMVNLGMKGRDEL